jgi:excisionase family DNA binding protein
MGSTSEAPTRPDLLTTDEAATYLGVSGPSLARWRSKRSGPAFLKVGALVRYERPALDSWLASRRHGEVAAVPSALTHP